MGEASRRTSSDRPYGHEFDPGATGKRGFPPDLEMERVAAKTGPMALAMNRAVLLVDDSVTARAKIRCMLESNGVKVIEADTGLEGLWRARQDGFDLIITDVHMPGMNGLEMIAELRKMPQYAEKPIFVLTTDASGLRAEAGKQAGVTAWVLKPVNPALLWKGIERALTSVSA